jgi:hypothetical protein
MKNARWTDEDGWIVEDIQHNFWQPSERPSWGFTMAMWVLMLVGALLISWSAFAHDPSHPEWNSWLMTQHNQNNGMCCDGEDTHVLADNEWRTVSDHYEVLNNGKWIEVPDWALTKTRDNPTGNALLWVWNGRVQCFKPGTFY